MKTKIKQLLVLSFLILNIQALTAQIGLTFSEIVKVKGTNYRASTAEGGIKYISYGEMTETDASGKFERRTVYYFTEGKDMKCWAWKIISPATELINYESVFNKKYTKTNEKQWKDYKNNLIYIIKVSDGLCTVLIHSDGRID